MTYFSTTTCRIVDADTPEENSELKFHDSVMGKPMCGVLVRPWHGRPMKLIETGEHEVDCGRCIWIHATQTRGSE
jgi:hypothetical protein